MLFIFLVNWDPRIMVNLAIKPVQLLLLGAYGVDWDLLSLPQCLTNVNLLKLNRGMAGAYRHNQMGLSFFLHFWRCNAAWNGDCSPRQPHAVVEKHRHRITFAHAPWLLRITKIDLSEADHAKPMLVGAFKNLSIFLLWLQKSQTHVFWYHGHCTLQAKPCVNSPHSTCPGHFEGHSSHTKIQRGV